MDTLERRIEKLNKKISILLSSRFLNDMILSTVKKLSEERDLLIEELEQTKE